MRRKSLSLFKIISLVILLSYSIILLGLLIWGLYSSLKNKLDFIYYPLNLPSEKYGWHPENYFIGYKILYVAVDTANGGTNYIYFPKLLLNSVIYSVGAAYLNMFTAMLVSYCCAKFKNIVTKIFYLATIIALTLPIVGALPSSLQIMRLFNLYDTMLGLILMKCSFAHIYFLVFFAVFLKIPKDYSDAAVMDGAGNWSIFIKIMMPMVSATSFACFLLLFITYWNDFSIPMIYLPSKPTIAYALYLFQNSRSAYASDPVKLAASFIVCLPSLLVFLCFRNKIMSNVVMGGIKG